MTFSRGMSQEEKIEHYREVVRTYVGAVNGRDLAKILSLYSETAAVHDPVGLRCIEGKPALREFYSGVIERAQLEIVGTIRGSHTNVVATPVRACIPGYYVDVVTLTRFDEDGLIENYAAYWGPTDMHPVNEA